MVCVRIFSQTTGGKTFSAEIQSHCMAGVSMQDFFRSKSVFYLILLKKLIKLNSASQQFTEAIDDTFYGFTGVITHAGGREKTKKASKSRAEGK